MAVCWISVLSFGLAIAELRPRSSAFDLDLDEEPEFRRRTFFQNEGLESELEDEVSLSW
jgi:hypothetical protein